MARIVGIDYGAKRVGIAVTDPLQIIPSALTTVPPDAVIAYLKKYMETETVEKIVIGDPRNLDGSETDATPLVRQFALKLQKAFPEIPVEFIDERLTSKIATQSLLQSGLKKKDRQRKELVDQASAVLILQSYLEKSRR